MKSYKPCRPAAGSSCRSLFFINNIVGPTQSRRHSRIAYNAGQQNQHVTDFLRLSPRLQCPSNVAVHRTLRTDSRCPRQLDQMRRLLIHRPLRPNRLTQLLHCRQIIRMPPFQLPIPLRSFSFCHIRIPPENHTCKFPCVFHINAVTMILASDRIGHCPVE